MGSTLVFHPSFDKAIIDKALEEDPERFGAEYLCKWRDDLCSFIDRGLLDAAADTGVIVRPPIAGVHYVAGCDASGGRNDSFTAAIAHKERDGSIVLDVAFERKAPFNPSEVVTEIVLRRTFSTGRERIDPGPAHDDLANSAAIALSLLSMTSMVRITDEHIHAIRPGPHGLRSRFGSRSMPFVGSISDRFFN